MKNVYLSALAALCLAACAETTVTQVSRNQILVSTSSTDCGRGSTMEIASKMAAVETLRRGYNHYIINNVNNESDSGVIFGAYPTYYEANNADLSVTMLNRGDAGFNQALDAKETLGPEWAKYLEEDITSCS